MLTFFKHRREIKKLEVAATENAIAVLKSVSGLLRAQVDPVGKDSVDVHGYIHSNFARGYIYGFIEAAIFESGIKCLDEAHLSIHVLLCHIYLFCNDAVKGKHYWVDTYCLLEEKKDSSCIAAKDLGAADFKSIVNASEHPDSFVRGHSDYLLAKLSR